MDVKHVAAALVFVCGLQVVTAGEWCTKNGQFWDKEYCDYGCCGSGNYEYCCVNNVDVFSETTHDGPISIAAIVGGVIGGIILLSIIIAVICACTKQSRPGRVVQPAPTAAVIMTHQQGYGFNPHQQYPPVGQGPGQTGNPAFPPPYPGQPQNAHELPQNAPPPAQYN